MTVVEKRTHDERIYDFDCVDLLAESEVITSVTSVAADVPGFTFGTPTINPSPIVYPDGHTSGAGKVVQVLIGGGVLGVPASYVDCTIRMKAVTNVSPHVEATVKLRLKDTP